MAIRSASVGDAAGLAALWREAGLRFDAARVADELRSVLARDPGLVLVDVDEEGEMVGAVLGTFDGRRGSVHRLAVRQDRRGHGIGKRLMAELEERLAAIGCPKVNLLVERSNAEVVSFYEALGYQTDDVIFMGKYLAGRDRRELLPELSEEPYVFVATAGPPPAVAMFAAILEDEGLTLVLTKADADRVGLEYSYVAARITLRVNSALDEIGLTAAVSRVLADADISCNVIAGAAHDHLFVDWSRRYYALDLLRHL
ncbi:MAG TPA: ACT domain-containing protein [Streptosporangiaceae bacterium]